MSEEEKKAIEYYQNKEMSFTCDIDTQELLKALGLEETEEDSFENHTIRFKTLLKLIEKQNNRLKQLEKENKELSEELNSVKEIYYTQRDIDEDYVPKSVIREKIKEYEELLEDELTQVTYWNEIQYTIRVLKKLLGGSNE